MGLQCVWGCLTGSPAGLNEWRVLRWETARWGQASRRPPKATDGEA